MFVRRAAVLLTCAIALATLPGTAAADPEAQARKQLQVISGRVQDAEAREGVVIDRITALDRRLKVSEREMNEIKERYGARARAAYQGTISADPIIVMLTAEDPSKVIDRLSLYAATTRHDDQMLRRGAALRRQLRTQRDELEQARRELERIERELAADTAELNALLERLGREERERERVEALREAREAARERAEASRARSRARARALATTPPRRTPPARASRSTARMSGRYACLVGPNNAFRDTWGAPRSGGRTHKGTDVFAPNGSPSYAVTDGVVTRTSHSSNGGLQVYLRGNDGNVYFYAHMSSFVARAGQRVSAGELIARVGDTGNARGTSPHVHFELHPGGGAPINPYPFVKRVCG